MIKELLNRIFSRDSSLGERSIAATIVLLVLALTTSIVFLGLVLVDVAGITPTKTTTTVVEEKRFMPAYATIIPAGKTVITQYHPEEYRLHFKIGEKKVLHRVDRELFDTIKVGDRIEVDYGFGRLSNSPQPTNTRLAEK